MSTGPNYRRAARRRNRAKKPESRVIVESIVKDPYDMRHFAKAAVSLQREKAAKAAASEQIAHAAEELEQLRDQPNTQPAKDTQEADHDAD